MFLKQASVMRVEGMPRGVLLNEEQWQQHVPIPPNSTTAASAGFVVIPLLQEWWRDFGFLDELKIPREAYGLQFLIEEKLIPSYAINNLLDKKVKELEESEGRKVGRKEKEEYRETILMGLLKNAPIRKTTFPVFVLHNSDDEQTIIHSAQGKNAGRLVAALCNSFGALKIKTIVFDGLTQGITERLKNSIAIEAGEYDAGLDVPDFNPFQPIGNLLLKRKNEKIKMQINEINNRNLLDFIDRERNENPWFVNELFLQDSTDDTGVPANVFKIDQNFRFKSIRWADVQMEESEGDDLAHEWVVLATIRCTAILGWVDTFSSMFMIKTIAPHHEDETSDLGDFI